MVDKENKIVKFGYGTVLVSANLVGFLTFTEIQPPRTIGASLSQCSDDVEFGEQFTILPNMRFLKELEAVTPDNPKLVWNHVTLDFTNFNSESVRVCIEKTKQCIYASIASAA